VALLRRRAFLNARDYIFLSMSAIGALRHWLWASKINLNDWTWELAVSVALFNFWFDWTHAQNLLRKPRPLNGVAFAGTAFFLVGSLIETVAEWQRADFKRRTSPKSSLYTGGLFRFATNINCARATHRPLTCHSPATHLPHTCHAHLCEAARQSTLNTCE
jgi:hypothetical protein